MKFNESKNCGYNGQCCRSQELRKENETQKRNMFIAKMLKWWKDWPKKIVLYNRDQSWLTQFDYNCWKYKIIILALQWL